MTSTGLHLDTERRRIKCAFAILGGLCLAVSTGCGDGGAAVSGVVSLDGDRIQGSDSLRCTVIFHPVAGGGAKALGIVDANGRYQLSVGTKESIEPGDYVVGVMAKELIPSPDPNYPPGSRQITPAKYASGKTSGFRFAVESGNNTIDLELHSH